MGQFSPLPTGIETVLATLAHHADRRLLRGRGGRFARLINRRGQTFINPEIGGRADLIRELDRRGVRYVALGRSLEANASYSGEHLALLVDDNSVGAVRRLVTTWPAGERCDTYSPSGLPGFAFGDMPLFPPKFARRLLDGARNMNSVSVPDPRDQFFSALYREIYLRGFDAGISSDFANGGDAIAPTAQDIEIAATAARLGIDIEQPVTLETLDALLARNDWRPPLDMLERIGCWNPWVARKLDSEGHGTGSEPPGLTVFYLRQRAIDLGVANLVLDTLMGEGFALLPVPDLTQAQLQEVAAEVRGGNWGSGPWPVSGGEPGLVLVGFDAAPIAPDEATLKSFPLLDNLRINTAKNAVRDVLQANLPHEQRYNPLHSTDNSVQAWRAIREIFAAQEAALREAIAPGSHTGQRQASG